MNRPTLTLHFARVAALVTLAGCQRPDPATPTPTTTTAETGSTAAAATAVCEAQRTLDRMDTRIAVPLVPMMANHQREDMRDHLLAVQEIVMAAATDDFPGVEHAAGRIGFSQQMGQKCTHMGAGATGFAELALTFHHTADAIAAAARQHDRVAVMQTLGATLQLCTGCHGAYRQSVVDDATWSRFTSALAPMEPARSHELGGR
jgi:hypothetical protein